MPATVDVVRDLVVVAVLLAVPAALALALAALLGIRSRPVQAIYAMAAPCLLGYASGAVYLLAPAAGRPFTVTVYAGVVVALGSLLATRRPQVVPMLRSWLAPAAMVLAATAFILGLGFLYGGASFAIGTAENRYLVGLPSDNALPQMFAAFLLAPQRPLPVFGGTWAPNAWSTSDRPPLQTCVYLIVRSIVPGTDVSTLQYQVTASLLQSLWMPALWCFFRAARARRAVIGLGLAVTLLSGFVIVNGFFTWPKLFPAAFLVLLAAIVLTDELASVHTSPAAAVACGLAAAMALLGHEGSALALIPLALVAGARRRLWPRLTLVGLGTAVLVVLMIPWTLYQSVYDPPGTKLTKLQLAGQGSVNPHQSLISAIVSAYEGLTPGQVAVNKLRNLEEPFLGEGAELSSLGQIATNIVATGGEGAQQRDAAIYQIRIADFFWILPLLGILALAPIAWFILFLRRARGPDLRVAGRLWVWLIASIVIWSLVLFGPGTTIIHQGSYALELLAFAAGAISLLSLLPRTRGLPDRHPVRRGADRLRNPAPRSELAGPQPCRTERGHGTPSRRRPGVQPRPRFRCRSIPHPRGRSLAEVRSPAGPCPGHDDWGTLLISASSDAGVELRQGRLGRRRTSRRAHLTDLALVIADGVAR